ncbi:MAG: ATP-dependent Clp protease ATP-binding subunit ClpC [Candidatus Sumerlaeota bacterium]|nr:ATP-dependent Clp protease ATP-binding subunit ClpC [Candidatus Sumerlaeota bacterium]
MPINDTPFTPGWKEVMRQSRNEAGRLGHDYIGPEHFLLGIIRKAEGLAVQTLLNLGLDLDDVKMELERMLEVGKGPTVGIFPQNVDAKKVIDSARNIARQLKHNWIGTEHLLLALIKEENTLASRCLRSFNIDYAKVKREVLNLIEGNAPAAGAAAGGGKASASESPEKSKTPALDTFGRDLTQLAREGKLDPVIGREDEIERILQVLCRRTKNNPILLGEPGVGKTAIVEGLAQRIVSSDIPDLLMDKRLLSLDLAAIVAGTKYRGQFEERLKAIMQEIQRSQDVLIFIDELHTLVGAGAAEGAIDASNMLKPALSRGEIQCIGATTLEEYRKYIEKDGALERRFQSIIINPPSTDQAVQILKGLRPRYESHHNVIISDEAISEAVTLSERYVTDRHLPDKAIDVIDEAGSRARLQANMKPAAIKEIEKEIAAKEDSIREFKNQQEFEKCAELKTERDEMQKRREELLEEWHNRKAGNEELQVISQDDVAYIISKWTGIPLMRLEEAETQKLLRMEEELGRRVVSQREAIGTICKAIRRSRSGLKDPARPTGSFIFLGPTGVGKTELAKALAELLFGSEEALIRIDMSEYMEKYSVSRLLGAPPGYVGYEEGGQLTEKVRQRPYSVVLLDEIEKAHPDVFSLLLQVFDDGRLTDSWGHIVDFRNTVIILTSNAGTRRIKSSGTVGFQAQTEEIDYDKMRERVLTEVKKVFNPEFINRLDELVVFHPLTHGDIDQIIDIMMGRLNKRLEEKKFTLRLDPEVRTYLVNKGHDPEYGARPLRRVLQNYVEDPLSMMLISAEIPDGSEVVAHMEEDGETLKFEVLSPEEQEKKEPALSASTS